jgi:CheY-like chemotaxis protein
LKQILLNLLGNAIKFTAHGGIHIKVTVSERLDDVAVLKLEVRDSGIGISTSALDKIFNPFIQADGSTTRQFGGSGLGLAICTRLTDLMGGRVWAESREGIGSTFYLQIPFVVNEAIVEHHANPVRNQDLPLWVGPPLRILLADDQNINLALATRILKKAGHTVIEAHDGMEAVAVWEREIVDVILMDIQMPIMSGIEATLAIREREKDSGCHMKIIAVTARALHEERTHILNQGFDGYVIKPFGVSDLLGEIRRCLSAEPDPT